MTYPGSVPPYAHPERNAFEQAYSLGNEVTAETISLDYKIEQLQNYAARQQELPDFEEDMDAIQGSVEETLRNANDETWTNYYRLLSRYAHLKELVYLPIVLDDPTQHEFRRELTDGLYGISASVLETILDHHALPDLTEDDYGDLRGAIFEQTALSLLNREQRTTRATMPASRRQDVSHKTDLVHLRLIDNEIQTLNIQIKGSLRSLANPEEATPDGGLLITARDMDNLNFETSRAICAELAGTATTEQIERLDRVEKRLGGMVDHKLGIDEPKSATVTPISRFAVSSFLKSA